MTPDFQIVEARPWHCGQMVRLLRAEQQRAIARLGVDSHRELRSRFETSAFRRAWLIDGTLAGLGGVTGSLLAAEGYVWLALSDAASRYPLAIVREARRQLAEAGVMKRLLVTSILDGDDGAKRFAIFLGFVLADNIAATPAASRFGRRSIAMNFDGDHAARLPLGKGCAVAMAWRPQLQQEVA
jgi:hypothetical protein